MLLRALLLSLGSLLEHFHFLQLHISPVLGMAHVLGLKTLRLLHHGCSLATHGVQTEMVQDIKICPCFGPFIEAECECRG